MTTCGQTLGSTHRQCATNLALRLNSTRFPNVSTPPRLALALPLKSGVRDALGDARGRETNGLTRRSDDAAEVDHVRDGALARIDTGARDGRSRAAWRRQSARAARVRAR